MGFFNEVGKLATRIIHDPVGISSSSRYIVGIDYTNAITKSSEETEQEFYKFVDRNSRRIESEFKAVIKKIADEESQ